MVEWWVGWVVGDWNRRNYLGIYVSPVTQYLVGLEQTDEKRIDSFTSLSGRFCALQKCA